MVLRATNVELVRCMPSIAARARRNVVEPISLHRFVSPEIYRYFHLIRPPDELLPELDLGADFLQPRENDLEASGRRRAAGCIDRQDRGPFPLQGRRLHLGKSDLL